MTMAVQGPQYDHGCEGPSGLPGEYSSKLYLLLAFHIAARGILSLAVCLSSLASRDERRVKG